MHSFKVRISKPGFDAGNAGAQNLYFYESMPTFKIVKQAGLVSGHQASIPHNFSYPPFFFAFSDENGELFPFATDKDTASIGGKNFMVGVDGANINFSDTTLNKKLIYFTDRPSGLTTAETVKRENYGLKIYDNSSPPKVIMSSEFNHLKEYISDSITIRSNHTNPGTSTGNNIVITTASGSIPHSLGFRPYIVATVRQIYHNDSINGGGTIDPNAELYNRYYFLPFNDIQYYNPVSVPVSPGVFTALSLYYGIKNNGINFYVKLYSNLRRGTDIVTGYNYVSYQTTDDFVFSYKIYYNDLDEAYSYL